MAEDKLYEVKEVQQWVNGLITYDEMIGLLKEKLDKKDKVSVYDMHREQFIDELSKRTSPGEVFANAHNIYDFMGAIFGENCEDSLLREWAFQWYCEKTGEDYSKIYDKWLGDV